MSLFDVVIVGSGVAGTAAALALDRLNVLMLDVGYEPSVQPSIGGDLYLLKKNDPNCAEYLLGAEFESLHNVAGTYLMPKLKGPRMRFVIKNHQQLCPTIGKSFFAITSFAKGGFANVWGAQLYRFSTKELVDFPFCEKDLDPYYDDLEKHIGISGDNGELVKYLGARQNLLQPIDAGPLAKRMLKIYERNRAFFNQRGFYMGNPHLAVLSKPYRGRPAYDYSNLEFFQPGNPSIYGPALTINELIEQKKICYESGRIVESFSEDPVGVSINAKNLQTGTYEKYHARRLVLAAGPINTAKIVLNAYQDFETKMPILDNLISYVPVLDPWMIGCANSVRGMSTQMAMIYEGPLASYPVMCTLYRTTGVLRSDLLFRFPLSLNGSISAAKYVLPALNVIQLWYSDTLDQRNYIRLHHDGKLEICYHDKPRGSLEAHIVNTLVRRGFISHKKLCEYPLPGNSFHYAGTVPMVESDRYKYTADNRGLLRGSHNVYIADASTFPALPSKNLSLTTMANAMRIAKHIQSDLERA